MYIDINSVCASIPVTPDGSVSFPLTLCTLQEKASNMCEFPTLSASSIHFHHSFVRPQLCNSSGDSGVAYTALIAAATCVLFPKSKFNDKWTVMYIT